jgi:hypothetical protein
VQRHQVLVIYDRDCRSFVGAPGPRVKLGGLHSVRKKSAMRHMKALACLESLFGVSVPEMGNR